MARGVNKVILIGNLGNDPDTRYMPNGNAVTRISVATSYSWKDRETGQTNDRTEWHRVVFFRRLAEIAGEYLKKGSKVYIEGSLRTSSYEKEGQKHYSTEVIADEMQMLDGRGDAVGGSAGGNAGGGFNQSQPTTAKQPMNSEPSFDSPPPEDFNDDIPF